MKAFSICLLVGLIAFSVAQRGFFPDSGEKTGYDNYEVLSSSQDDSFESSSEEIALASRSIKRSEPQYGQSCLTTQDDNSGNPLKYDFLDMTFPNIFDVGRFQGIQAFRKACIEADLEGMEPKKCYDCLEDIADHTIHHFEDLNKIQLWSRVKQCSNRYLKKDSKFGKCDDLIHENTLRPNKEDRYMTMQHYSPGAQEMDDDKSLIWPTSPLTWSWQFPLSNYYRCIHSQSLKKQKSQCGGDSSCISKLFDKSMTTLAKPPTHL